MITISTLLLAVALIALCIAIYVSTTRYERWVAIGLALVTLSVLLGRFLVAV